MRKCPRLVDSTADSKVFVDRFAKFNATTPVPLPSSINDDLSTVLVLPPFLLRFADLDELFGIG